jgi:hypothetical protein
MLAFLKQSIYLILVHLDGSAFHSQTPIKHQLGYRVAIEQNYRGGTLGD